MNPLSLSRLLAISSLGFALTLTTNTLEPAVLTHKVLALVPERSSTALGFTTFLGLVAAMLVQPVVGALSDRTRSRWGRRVPYFVAGALVGIGCLYLIALAPVFALVVLGVVAIQLAANIIQGPWQALIPDLVPSGQRGLAAGVKAMFDILALVVGRLIAGQLVGRYAAWGPAAVVAAVSVPVAVYALALLVTLWGVRASGGLRRSAEPAPAVPLRRAILNTLAVDFRAYPAFGWWLVNRLLFWAGFVAVTTFLVLFVVDVIGLPEAEAQPFVGNLATLLGLALVVVTLPAGWLADRLGRRPIVIASGGLATAGTGWLLLAGADLAQVAGAAVLVGLGVGFFLSANWALATDIVPGGAAARYLGVANMATAGGSALARLLGSVLVDPLNQALGSSSAGYQVLYGLAAVFFLLSALAALRLPGRT
ncbi:MAG: MFS transporter [Anaerolineales bacterium]|nr:MFS transporter [Anaerolineales bacterium]